MHCKLVNFAETDGSYAAISYCWGELDYKRSSPRRGTLQVAANPSERWSYLRSSKMPFESLESLIYDIFGLTRFASSKTGSNHMTNSSIGYEKVQRWDRYSAAALSRSAQHMLSGMRAACSTRTATRLSKIQKFLSITIVGPATRPLHVSNVRMARPAFYTLLTVSVAIGINAGRSKTTV